MPKISAVLIAQDEEDRIEAALRSLSFCDEIVVVDGGSRDTTAARVSALGARLLERPFDGFVAQKNFAVDQARHEVVLSLDADEEVSHALRKEIQALCAGESLPLSGYRIPRVTHYLGREIRATDWYPDWQLRLFDRRQGRFEGDLVHESVRVDGPVGRLSGEIIHRPYRDEDDHLRRIDRYTTLWAEAEHRKGRKAVPGYGAVASFLAFLRNYFFKRGIFLGTVGLRISRLNAFYVQQKFAKLKALEDAAPRPS
ncbi:MAG TPA: glycosyltransferase family 2 protein [Vicinamibacteria bacterium]|nr:glycosyltransferase family 2 protein [Vicinamibacteria bacterium]HRB12085.1 glycosyltransferase family 2 protein [Vicinamibacteria bacterium]